MVYTCPCYLFGYYKGLELYFSGRRMLCPRLAFAFRQFITALFRVLHVFLAVKVELINGFSAQTCIYIVQPVACALVAELKHP